jgi:hypothetical protein
MGVRAYRCTGVGVYILSAVHYNYFCSIKIVQEYDYIMGVWVYGRIGVQVYGCTGVWVYGCMGV